MAIQQVDSEEGYGPELLRERDYREILEFLTRRVPANLFQLSWLENHGVRPVSDSGLFAFRGLRGESGRLRAVSLAVTDRLVLVEAERPDLAARMGRWYRREGAEFGHVVSAADRVAPFWEAYAAESDGERSACARLDRDQVMFQLEPGESGSGHLASAYEEPERLRLARPRDFDPLFLASARMHREETLEDPLDGDPDGFRRHVRHRIEADRSWVWFGDGRRLVFKADVSARSRHGVQISGVYTAPETRGQGIATRGMAEICRRLFEEGVPRVVLYVNRANGAARRVYEKVGFDEVADYRTIFVADGHPSRECHSRGRQ